MKNTINQLPKLKQGMTLLEIVIVVAIIGIILGAGLGFFGGALGGAKITAAQAKINGLKALLESYKTLAGSYPTTNQGLQALVERPSTSPKPRNWVQQAKSVPVDPWQIEYAYKFPSANDPTTYEIISAGPDLQLGTEDDISSQDEL